jgi:lysophospholipase L1-like esterase
MRTGLLVLTLLAGLLAAGLPLSAAAGVDLSRLVVVGDSLSAGVQNGTLTERYQRSGYASLLAAQAGVDLPLPPLAGGGPTAGAPTQPRNLAVSGARLADARAQVDRAVRLGPTAVVFWIGSNDALSAALSGEPSRLTPVPDFERTYTELLGRLARTGATLVVANIADVTRIPAAAPAPPDSVAAVRSAVAAYNRIIAERARAAGALLVDVAALFDRVDAAGIEVAGRRLTTAAGGGLFSADGVHPSDVGHAVLANAFIDAINARFGAAIPKVPLAEVVRRAARPPG